MSFLSFALLLLFAIPPRGSERAAAWCWAAGWG